MHVRCLPTCDQVEFRSQIIGVTPREPIALFDTSCAERTDRALDVCSWCKMVDVADLWLEAEDAFETSGSSKPPVCRGSPIVSARPAPLYSSRKEINT